MSISDILNNINNVQNSINGNSPLTSSQASQYQADGFTVPAQFASSAAVGAGLPSSQVPPYRPATLRRNIITWFVPNFGIVSMYINPSAITYNFKKLINPDRTKGGYTLQYWGEQLDVLNISGTTGSSGIEGINVLYEIYRAEQYAFDATGLLIAGNNATTDLSNSLSGLGGALGGAIGGGVGAAVGGAVGGLLGLAAPNTNLSAQNIPSIAQSAFSVEMYYNGWVYRGYFNSMTVRERADNFMLEYDMEFITTSRQGYRLNYFPWSVSANSGPSSYSTPESFNGNVSEGF